jgi:hypothetical protein
MKRCTSPSSTYRSTSYCRASVVEKLRAAWIDKHRRGSLGYAQDRLFDYATSKLDSLAGHLGRVPPSWRLPHLVLSRLDSASRYFCSQAALCFVWECSARFRMKGTHVHPHAFCFGSSCSNAMHCRAIRSAGGAVNAGRGVQDHPRCRSDAEVRAARRRSPTTGLHHF